MNAFLIDATNQITKIVDIDFDDLDKIREILGFKCLEYVKRKVEHIEYLFICDENGLLKDNQIASAVNDRNEVMFVGNLLITREETVESYAPLTSADISIIRRNLVKIDTKLMPGQLLINCNYKRFNIFPVVVYLINFYSIYFLNNVLHFNPLSSCN